jgi:hypothetical protein
MFDSGVMTALLAPAPESTTAEPDLPVLPVLRGELPGLRRGQVMSVDGAGALAAALAAGVSADGGWCAAVGMPDLGVLAAVAMGVDPQRLLLVDEPGERWPEVVATMLGAVELVLLRPPVSPSAVEVRRLTAHARRHGAVLVTTGLWEGAQVRLRVVSSLWTGLSDGHGHLRGRRVQVVVEGKGPPRKAWLWLPGPDGSIGPADLVPVEEAG